MSFFFNQPDPKRRRFPIPNGVWKWELKPQGFAILAYLCYLHVHCNKNALPSADEIASQLHMSKDMAVKQIAELNRRGLLDQHKLYLTGQGVTHDQTQAMVWFSRSAAQGNQYAQFFLERQNDLRPPSVMLAATRLLYHMSRIFENHALPHRKLYEVPIAPRDYEAVSMYAAVAAHVCAQRECDSASDGGLLGYN